MLVIDFGGQGVSNKTISRWETGNYMPSVESLKDILVLVLVDAIVFIANTLNIVAVAAKKDSLGQ